MTFLKEMRQVPILSDFVVQGNKQGDGQYNLTKFHLSREDFFYYQDTFVKTSEVVEAVCVSPQTDDDSDLTEIYGVSVDAKLNTKDMHPEICAS